jgi:hypothetical protein
MQSKLFSLPISKVSNVKYFGVDYEETVAFANKIQLIDIVAIIEAGVLYDTLLRIGDFTHVDSFLFKKGTIIIQAEDLHEFNKAVQYIEHRY